MLSINMKVVCVNNSLIPNILILNKIYINMKIGDKVIYIDNRFTTINLDLNKIYTINYFYKYTDNLVDVELKEKLGVMLSAKRFITLKEYRTKKLKILL